MIKGLAAPSITKMKRLQAGLGSKERYSNILENLTHSTHPIAQTESSSVLVRLRQKGLTAIKLS
jgi:hypothetical protein